MINYDFPSRYILNKLRMLDNVKIVSVMYTNAGVEVKLRLGMSMVNVKITKNEEDCLMLNL